MQNAINPFVWNEINLSQVVMIDGMPHSTKTAIGEWLEYAEPLKAINKIIERNPHLREYSVDVKLTSTDGKKYDSEVYHPIGFLLIVMESGQPRAHAMKAAVAEFAWNFAGPRKLSQRDKGLFMKLRMELLDRLGKVRDAFVQTALLHDLREVSLQLGLPVPDMALLGTDARQKTLPGV